QDIAVLERYGVPYRRLKPEECAEFEPALARVTAKIAGGLHLPADATGDCHLFTQNLYQLCLEKGVQFHFNQTIRRIEHNGQRISAVETEKERFEADVFVCALGCFSRTVLA
ncbi:FAD-dependent oxidoreductase, partial [Neisseria sp. P0015.S002]